MKKLIAFAPLAYLALTACSPAEGLCSKEFECQEDLGLSLEDDYVAVCTASLEGANNALRKNAEPQCEELANAQVGLATCQSALDCENLVKSRTTPGGEEDPCSAFSDTLTDALAATDGGAACDAVEDDAGEGEGEGE